MIIASGPVGGTMEGTGTFSVVTKGPMTNGALSSQANGFMGAYMKFAGFDSVVIQGAAKEPVYLYLHDGVAEIRDATALVGKDTWETQDAITKELGKSERQLSVFSIGPAGEHCVEQIQPSAAAGRDVAGDRGRSRRGDVGLVDPCSTPPIAGVVRDHHVDQVHAAAEHHSSTPDPRGVEIDRHRRQRAPLVDMDPAPVVGDRVALYQAAGER